MYDTAFITSIKTENGIEKITVIPLIKDACLSCKKGCAKRGNPFEVINPQNFPIKVNSIVKIGTSGKSELLQALSAILFPTLCAVVFYFVLSAVLKYDGLKALSALAGFIAGAFIVFFSARHKKNIAQPEITELCS